MNKTKWIASGILLFVSIMNLSYAVASEDKAPPVYVNVIKAGTKTWQEDINATGTLIADQGVVISADVSGRVTQIYFKSGNYVKAGTPLIQLFPDILKAQLRQYQATLNLAKLNFDRFQSLYKKNATSQSELDTARAKYNEAEADVIKTQAQLAQTTIKAPFSGYLGIRKINVGAYLSAGDAIVNLEDTDPMFVDFSIPEVFVKKIAKGQSIEIYSPTYGKRKFKGKIVALESLINPDTRMLEVRAAIPNKDNILTPGSFVVVDVYVGQPKNLVFIPQTAIQYSEEGDYVYVVKNNKAVKTSVKLGRREDKNIYIVSGLKAGEQVVTAGAQRLYDGAQVVIEKANAKK